MVIIGILISWFVVLPAVVIAGLYLATGARQRRPPGVVDASVLSDDYVLVAHELANLAAGTTTGEAEWVRTVAPGY